MTSRGYALRGIVTSPLSLSLTGVPPFKIPCRMPPVYLHFSSASSILPLFIILYIHTDTTLASLEHRVLDIYKLGRTSLISLTLYPPIQGGGIFSTRKSSHSRAPKIGSRLRYTRDSAARDQPFHREPAASALYIIYLSLTSSYTRSRSLIHARERVRAKHT